MGTPFSGMSNKLILLKYVYLFDSATKITTDEPRGILAHSCLTVKEGKGEKQIL
uniref:Uncharacterized protein n=1 Tax=Tetraselmis sp. GSL018 TaxID=582737 RepID=A0A061SC37_9CHLO